MRQHFQIWDTDNDRTSGQVIHGNLLVASFYNICRRDYRKKRQGHSQSWMELNTLGLLIPLYTLNKSTFHGDKMRCSMTLISGGSLLMTGSDKTNLFSRHQMLAKVEKVYFHNCFEPRCLLTFLFYESIVATLLHFYHEIWTKMKRS